MSDLLLAFLSAAQWVSPSSPWAPPRFTTRECWDRCCDHEACIQRDEIARFIQFLSDRGLHKLVRY